MVLMQKERHNAFLIRSFISELLTFIQKQSIFFNQQKKLNTRQSDGEKNLKNHLKDYVRGGNSGGAFLKGLEGAFWRWGGFKGGRI